MYDHGFMDNTNRQAVKTDLIHRQEMRPLRHGGSPKCGNITLMYRQLNV